MDTSNTHQRYVAHSQGTKIPDISLAEVLVFIIVKVLSEEGALNWKGKTPAYKSNILGNVISSLTASETAGEPENIYKDVVDKLKMHGAMNALSNETIPAKKLERLLADIKTAKTAQKN